MNIRKVLPGLWALAMLSVSGVVWAACDGPSTGDNCETGIHCVGDRETGEMICQAE